MDCPSATRRLALLSALALACSPAPEAPPDAGQRDAGTVDAGTAPHALCVDGVSVDGLYPKVAYGWSTGDTLPDVTLSAVDASGAPSSIALHDFFEPCAARSRLLVLRVGAGWCGTCRWSVAHLGELIDPALAAQLQWVDVLLRDDDNAPSTAAFAAEWQTRSTPPGRVAIDPEFTLAPLDPVRNPLPLLVVLDRRTMEIRLSQGDPDPDVFVRRLRLELARLNHEAEPPPTDAPVFDGVFVKKQWDMLHDMRLPAAPPADPTNAKADDPQAAALGRALFFDTSLSPSHQVSCATCHDPQKHFGDGAATSTAVGVGDRNAPSVLLAPYARSQFWDGRADTLWAQATGPFENPVEFSSSRLFLAHAVRAGHREAYGQLFGALPPLEDGARFPAAGKPGDPAWEAMSAGDRAAVSRVLANVGKAIAAFERTLRVKPNRLDAYLSGQSDALTAAEKTGAVTFFQAGCAQCHYGPRLTDDAFHNLRFPTGRQDGRADDGLSLALPSLLTNEFRSDGPFSDSPVPRALAARAPGGWSLGAFRTAPLRGITGTAPYGHGGTFQTLREVVEHYSDAGLPPSDARASGVTEPWVPRFAKGHVEEIVRFLEVLEADAAD